jgi:peptide deformylase
MKLLTIDSPEDWASLKEPSLPVENFNADLSEITGKMLVFMKESNGIGLAAPQIGINQRFFVVQLENQSPFVFVNPEIVETSVDLSSYEEGCLSIPGTYAKVFRPSLVTMQAYDAKGKRFQVQASGLFATCIQHELDHLNGKLFIEHLPQRRYEKILKSYQGSQRRSLL